MNNNNINFNTNDMNKIKNMVDNGNISEAISQISPEMIENISQMFSQNNPNNNNNNNKANNTNTTTNSNFDLNNLDLNTISKISSTFGKLNNSKNDPRSNLLNSLKPYLRDSKKEKLDNYMNLLNVSKIAEILKNNDKENNNNA